MVIFAINSPKVRYFTNCSVSHAPKRSAKTTKCAKGSLPVCFDAVSVFSMGAIAFIIPSIVSRLSLNVNTRLSSPLGFHALLALLLQPRSERQPVLDYHAGYIVLGSRRQVHEAVCHR